MTLKQLENLVKIDEDMTNPEHGTYYNKRTIEQLLEYGLILIDKPPGPTSHEVVAWTKRILEIPKAGHSGTLDPQVTGVLPLGLGEGTKALGVLLLGPKEYHALGRLHSLPSIEKLENICLEDEANCLLHAKVVSCTLNSSASRYLHMHALHPSRSLHKVYISLQEVKTPCRLW